MFSFIPHAPGPFASFGGRAWTPIDDNHVNVFTFGYRNDRPFNEQELLTYESGGMFPPRVSPGKFTLPGGYIIDTFLPVASKENDYEIDRDMQRNVNFTGIWGVHDQDRALAENARNAGGADQGILDRGREHLVSADRAIVTARRALLKMIRELQEGAAPAFIGDAEAFRVRAISKICDTASFDDFIAAYGEEAHVRSQESSAA
jgi:phthalate 4,5-dioxygenase